ncbi:hypothetical protein AC579_8508 [Pseudocercospora musae]|uniref:Uncharacterized protein n=1 Tax=Pseudocercospora musae TaxID=113226 RepID=A0A139I9S9_9PEZI|nr:hypothetical protein AC579_8508 [Pseudocercospora musae]
MPIHRSWTSVTDSTSGTSCPGDSAASRVEKADRTNKRARPDFVTFVARNPPPRPTNLATPQNSILHVGLVKTHEGRCLPSALEFAPVQVDNVVFHFPLPPPPSASSACSDIAHVPRVTDLKLNLDDHKSMVVRVTSTALDPLTPPPDYSIHDPFAEEEQRGRQMTTTPGLSRRALSEPRVVENPCPCSRDRSLSKQRPASKAGRESLQALKERLDQIATEADDDPFKDIIDAAQARKLGATKNKPSKRHIKTISYQSVCATGPEKIISYQSLCPSGEPIDREPVKKPTSLGGFQLRQPQRERLESFDTVRDLPIAAEFKRRDSEIEFLFGQHQQVHRRNASKGTTRTSPSRSSKADRILGGYVPLGHQASPARPTTSASKADRLLGEFGTIRSSREGRPNIAQRASTALAESDTQSIFRKRAGSATKHIRKISNHDAQTLWKPSDLWKPHAKIDRSATVASRTSVTISSAALANKLGVPISTDVGLERGNCSIHDMGAFAQYRGFEDDDGLSTFLPELDIAFSLTAISEREKGENNKHNLKRMGLPLETKYD